MESRHSSSVDAEKAKEQQLIGLAVLENHDADIPSNKGVILTKTTSRISQIRPPASSNTMIDPLEQDVEKHANGSLTSNSTSHNAVDDTNPNAHSNHDHGEEQDPNIVWWDGDDDSRNPMNWSSARRWLAVCVVSMLTFLAPLASSIFAPGVPKVMAEFNSTSNLLSGFVISVYVLGFAAGPLIIAPLSELYGRLPLYHICNFLFILCNVGCALSTSLTMLIVFRFLAGCMGSSPLALGGGTIADVMPASQRAKAMSIWVMGPTIGPVVGPVCGAFISESLGWRWNFWILCIATGVATVIGLLVMRETYAPVLLEQKAKKLRKSTGNPNLKSKVDIGLTAKDLFWFSISRPTKMLLFSPMVLFLSLYVAVVYAYLYLFFTTISEVMEKQYHFKTDLVGLAFLGLGVGQFFGQFLYSWVAGRLYEKARLRGDIQPEDRLPPMVFGAIIIPIGLFWYGWSLQAHTQWIVPLIGTAIFCLGLVFIWLPANVYLIDVYTKYAASAMAANTVFRSVVAAILPLAGPKMYAKLGYGWGNSLLGFIALAMIPIPFYFMKRGAHLRKKYILNL